jgi:hypothetical protein
MSPGLMLVFEHIPVPPNGTGTVIDESNDQLLKNRIADE